MAKQKEKQVEIIQQEEESNIIRYSIKMILEEMTPEYLKIAQAFKTTFPNIDFDLDLSGESANRRKLQYDKDLTPYCIVTYNPRMHIYNSDIDSIECHYYV